MVISSSPARSNDQSLKAAKRSTTSRGLMRRSPGRSTSDMPSPRFGFMREAHATARTRRHGTAGDPEFRESPVLPTIHRPTRGPKNIGRSPDFLFKDSPDQRNASPPAVHSVA